LTARPPILIAGAGIGGLATALALAKHNLASHVLEKRTDPSEEGAGIQIGPNGVHVLRQLGVADALAPLTASPASLRVMDGVSGRELTTLPLGSTIAERHGAPYWSAHRADLHAALFQAAQESPLITLSLGSEVHSAASQPSGVNVTLTDNSELSAPALIAADGLWSRLRDAIFKAPPLQHASKHAYRAVIPARDLPAGLCRASTHIWLSPRAHVVHYPVRGGDEIALVAVLSDNETMLGWGTNVPSARLRSRFEGSTAALRDLIDRPDSWRGWPLMVPSGSTSWVDGRIALLGDAAHPILPFLAQGAVMALEDAVTVAKCLARSPDDVATALSTYAAQRLPRTECVARASQRNGQIYHLPGPFAAVRNAILRKAPQQRLLASYDWLYGWRSIGQS
jgi:salicylate hydroxylase